MTKNRFEGKIVLVTGSDSGIGQQILLAFAREGASVAIHGIADRSIEETVGLLKEEGVNESRYFKIKGLFDDDKFFEELVEGTVERFGKLDILVNNAGVAFKPGMDPTIDSFKVENIDYIWKINARAPFALTELAFPHLQKTKGCIINTCSIYGLDIAKKVSTSLAYCTSKSALITLTKIQSIRYAALGVRVNGILPGFHETPLLKKCYKNLETKEDAERYNNSIKTLANETPTGVLGGVSELAQRYLDLAASTHLSGALWVQDGGKLHWASESEYPL